MTPELSPWPGIWRLSGLAALFALVLASPALAQTNPAWMGRPFVRVLAKGDPIPGTTGGALFNVIENFTLRDGKIHIVAGEAANKKGLFRWHNGVLTKLVYTDTLAPNGSTFDTVHFTTDETEGALNFFGEVFFGRPGFVYGLFEWRNGVITKVFDTQSEIAGKQLSGFGYPVRVGHEVVGSAQFVEGGVRKMGILRWDGTTLRTVIQTGDDLPGSLGGFTGQPGSYQVAFDGQNVGFVASDDSPGRSPTGVYRTGPDGTISRLIDGNDLHPSGSTYAALGIAFANVDLDGTNSFLGVGGLVSAAGGNSFYGLGYRYTGGTINVATSTFGNDGKFEAVLRSSARLDGQKVSGINLVDGQGDDVAFLVQLADGTQAIYAAIGTTVTPPAAPVLAAPTLADGSVTLRFASLAGKTYRVEFRAALGDPAWTARGDLAGTGAELTFSETAASAGFYRVTLLP
jgi:hypothetical protein